MKYVAWLPFWRRRWHSTHQVRPSKAYTRRGLAHMLARRETRGER